VTATLHVETESQAEIVTNPPAPQVGFLLSCLSPKEVWTKVPVTFSPQLTDSSRCSLAIARTRMTLVYTCVRTIALGAALVCLGIPGSLLATGDSGAVRPGPTVANSTVRGVVWNPDNSPLPNGKVRLRDVHTGKVEAASVTTERGQFLFEKIQRGSYLTEVVDDGGKVIAVGQSFSLEAGETVATFVRLPPRQSWLAGAFTNTAAAVISAASSAGVTAIGSKAPPVSPQ
jgi:hypothetical protein